MLHPIENMAALHNAVASKVEEQVRKDAAGLDPLQIEQIVAIVLRYGPSMYRVILSMFHLTPKA